MTSSTCSPRLVGDRPLVFDETDDHRAAFLLEELGGVVADIAEPLHDHSFALETGHEIERTHVTAEAADLSQRVEDSAAGGLGPALDAALLDGFGRSRNRGR